jgi:hypothetical protein
MDDELNIDPRETDYLDHIDMNQAINFYELRTQLAGLGFNEDALLDQLRGMVAGDQLLYDIGTTVISGQDKVYFDLAFEKTKDGYQLYCIDASMDKPHIENNQVMQYFKPDVSVDIAAELLRLSLFGKNDHNPFMPLSLQEAQTYIHLLKTNHVMNDQNLSYLQKQLLNLGFGEKLNEELEKNIKAEKKEFTLATTQEYNKQNVDYTLHYKAGDQNDMYFFNKYDASLQDKEMQQTFYLNKGSGITAKEAYNLMEGRAVHKELENLEGQKYNAWIIIDKENKTENGNFKLRPFTDGWNYKPEKAIDKMDIVGINEDGAREKLMKSLEKGNRHQVTALKDGKEVKLYIEANPADHRINLTNYKGEAQQLEHYKKPEFKNENKKDQMQAQGQEDAPAKKQRKGAKMNV